MNLNQFLKSLPFLFISLFLAISTSLLLNNYSRLTSSNWWISLVFYGCIFFTLNIIYNFKNSNEKFAQLLLGTLIVKLLLAFILMLIYRLLNTLNVVHFAMHFLIHYLIFTVFEMYYIFKLIKSKQKQ